MKSARVAYTAPGVLAEEDATMRFVSVRTGNVMNKLVMILAVVVTAVVSHGNPHFVFVTFDDLSRESIGIHGSEVPEITPSMDRIARSGMRFEHFHVQSGNCTPSRNIIMSGMYQQHNGVFALGKEGAGNQKLLDTMPSIFQRAGYHTGIMGKNPHQCAFEPFSGWDQEYDGYGSTRDPDKVYSRTVEAIQEAKRLGKPLFFNLNIYDPHTGWYGWDPKTGPKKEGSNHPSRIYGPDEVPYPSWFPPLSKTARVGTTKEGTKGVDIMLEVAAYYNSVKRSDDSFGKMLQAFDEAGWTDDLILVVISDHGVQLAGAKTTLYNEGSISPLFIQWPGVTKPGSINESHMVGSIDLLPTFCEMIGYPIPSDLDGRSIVPLLKQKQPDVWRDYVYKQQNDRNKSRAIQTRDWLYIINHWADGVQRFGSVTSGMHSWKIFKDALENPETSPVTRDWVRRIEYRMPEELFHLASDPGCLQNLAGDAAYSEQLQSLRKIMETEARASGDTVVLEAIRNPQDSETQKAAVATIEKLRLKRSHDPDYARDIMYDPHDGWMVIDNTIFEPFGEWGIWKSASSGAGLSKNNGYETAGSSCVEFDGEIANSCGIVTSRFIDGTVFDQLKLEFRIPWKTRKNKGKNDKEVRALTVTEKTTLSVIYRDDDDWKVLKTLTGKEIRGDKRLELDPPSGGWPDKLLLGIQADFGGKGGYIPLDAIRFTGWQDWTPCGERDSVKTVLKLSSGNSSEVLSDTMNARGLGTIELEYRFYSESFGTGDRLFVEYFTGHDWILANIHDYGYVLTPGTTYSGRFIFNANEHDLSKEFRIRFRSESPSVNKGIIIEDIRLRSRQAALLN